MNKYKRLGKNTVLVSIGNLGSKLISFLMLPFYTKWLSVSDYGVTEMVGVYVSFLLGIVTFSIADAIFIFPKDQKPLNQRGYFSSGLAILFIGISVTAVLFFIIEQILKVYLINNTFTEYIWIIYLILILTGIQIYLQQFARSLDKIIVYAISGIILTICTAIFSFFFIPRYGLDGYFISQILALTVTSLYTFVSSKSYSFSATKYISKKSGSEMLKYSIPLIPNAIMWWIGSALNRPIIEKYLGTYEVGIFAIANKFPSVITILFIVISYSWQISVIEEYSRKEFRSFYNRIIQIVFSVLILISCVMGIISPFIIYVVDAKFVDAALYIPIMSISVVFFSLSGMVGTIFSATRESKYFFYSSTLGAICNIALSFILIPKYGLYGSCFAIIGTHLTIAVSRIIYSWKHVPLDNIYKYIFLIIINILLVVYLQYNKWSFHQISSWLIMLAIISIVLFLNRDIFQLIKNKIWRNS